jgi:DNA polymerase II large subunit
MDLSKFLSIWLRIEDESNHPIGGEHKERALAEILLNFTLNSSAARKQADILLGSITAHRFRKVKIPKKFKVSKG